jgi:hypothetical protein
MMKRRVVSVVCVILAVTGWQRMQADDNPPAQGDSAGSGQPITDTVEDQKAADWGQSANSQ